MPTDELVSSPVHDREHMARAIALAERGLYTTDPNPRVGCVVVRDGRVVGEGWHRMAGEPHAEVNALRAAGDAALGATAYVTLEPCRHQGRTGPCSRALIEAGITRVVVGMLDPNPEVRGGGLAELETAGIAVESGVLETQARALNPGFVARMTRGRPFVRCKLAMSLDGRTAMASGESRWITGPPARADVHRWRARSAAVVTGVGTVLADDPAMTARPEEFGESHAVLPALKVVLDSSLRMPPGAKVLSPPGSTLVVFAHPQPDRMAALEAAGADLEVVAAAEHGVDLAAAMQRLAAREINEVLLECGPTLAGACLAAGLVDEILLYVAPVLMGDAARGLFHLPAVRAMADRHRLDIVDIRQIGDDWRVTAIPLAPRLEKDS